MDYDVENIIITSNFSVKDLFKKIVVKSNNNDVELEEIETKLYEKINSKNKINVQNKRRKKRKKKGKGKPRNIIANQNLDKEKNIKNILFVFHNIHKAESDVLSKISEIFNKNYEGNSYSFIGLINIKESLIERNSYYYNYFYNSIYYIVDSANSINTKYLEYIIPKEINTEASKLLDYYKNHNNDNIFTLSDIRKYILLKQCSNYDDSFIKEIIFDNRYLLYEGEGEGEGINNYINKNKSSNNFNLDFYYKNNTHEFLMEVNGISTLSFQALKQLDNFEKKKNTLTLEQKKCLIFLGLAVKAKLACIIQGPTGVGKSHLIKLFANILGKDLKVFELNKDNHISLLTKSCNFKMYSKKEEEEIEKELDEILELDDNNANKHLSINKKIEIIFSKENLTNDKRFKDLREKYKFIRRFNYENSDFLNAVKNGDWILLDGIENAPPLIAEKIALLCGEKPELNLYEKDQPPIKPKEGFHLFITYNKERGNYNGSLSKSFLDKCLIYNLKSFLNNEDISQMMYGFLVNLDIITEPDILINIASRFSNIHNIINNSLNSLSFDNITERNTINYFKNLKKENIYHNNMHQVTQLDKTQIQKQNLKGKTQFIEKIDIFASTFKNNFLYFYFPSLKKKELTN